MNQGIPPSFGYPSLDTGNEIAFKRSQNDVKDISKGINFVSIVPEEKIRFIT